MDLVRSALHAYRQHLAPFLFFRLLKAFALTGWRLSYRLRSWLARVPESGKFSWRALSSVDGYVDVVQHALVVQGEVLDIPKPFFVGYGATEADERTSARKIDCPPLTVTDFPSVVIVGGMDFIFAGRSAVHHDLFRPVEHCCPAENVGVIVQKRDGRNMRLYLSKPALSFDRVVSLIGQCSGNYAHWLTETLPKLPLVDSVDAYSNLPLLIDAGLHPNLMASIGLINKNQRPIIQIERWRPARVNRVLVVSAPGYERYVPEGIHSIEPPPYVNTFSRSALQLLRSSVVEAMAGRDPSFQRSVYLARSTKSGNLRALENVDAIERALSRQHIQAVVPELMRFEDQVATCLYAELIVAPIGAALANMIFAPQGCRVVILSPYYNDAHFHFYTNLAGALGHQLTFVLGQQVGPNRHPMHRNYRINTDEMIAAL